MGINTYRFKRVDGLLLQGDNFGAAVKLGALWSARMQSAETEYVALREQVLERLNRLDADRLRDEAFARRARLQRILSVGDTFEFEELVLALTLRVEVALVSFLLASLRSEAAFAVDFRECDDRLKEIARERTSAAAYRDATKAIDSHWRKEAQFDVSELGLQDLL